MKILLLLIVLSFQTAFSQWGNLDSGINDTLTDVVFFNDTGLVSGESGLYYTLNGGNGSINWQRFEVTDNSQNAILYNNTKFNACYANPNNTQATFTIYAVGEDLVNNKAVVMAIDFPSLNYNIISLNVSNSALMDINYSKNYGRFYAVGNNGLLIYFTNNINNYTTENNSTWGDNITDDFISIVFDTNGYQSRIGSNGRYFKMSTGSNPIATLTSNEMHQDVTYTSSGVYSVSERYLKCSYSNKTIITDYDYGPLNGNTIYAYGSNYFIGTDHGIFKSTTDKKILEWQPSSLNYNINSFWSANGTSTMYACGTNGVILKNQTPSSEAKPYAKIDFSGGCLVSTSFNIDAVIGSSTSCNWYIDNNLISSVCGSFNHTFTVAGDYQIKLVVENNGLITEDIKNIHIVTPPQVDKPYSILDSILCHEESLEITINNTEPNVAYTLKKTGSNDSFGTSQQGNGGTIIFNTSLLNETGTFYLQSINVNAPSCFRNFTDTFDIIVEQTEADFHFDLINSQPSELVTFHENSVEANNYEWTFPGNSNILNSNSSTPTTYFTSSGQTNINLNVWSDDGCYDNITKQGPNVYEQPAQIEECWTLVNSGEDVYNGQIGYAQWFGSHYPEVIDLTKVSDGFLTSGYYNNQKFDTKLGVTYDKLETKAGSYLVKHDFNGTIKWVVYTEKAPSSDRDIMYSSVEDSAGNIYVCGNSEGVFYDNTGTKIVLNSNSYPGFIIKLDSRGKLIWHIKGQYFYPKKLHLDKNDNLISTGNSQGNANQLYLNGIASQTFQPISTTNINYVMLKFSSDGNLIWDTGIYMEDTISNFLTDVGFDASNNIYITGFSQQEANFYSTNSTTPIAILDSGGMFLAKLNENGEYSWGVKSTVNEATHAGSRPFSIATDTQGNTYISGANNCQNSSRNHVFSNTDGTTTEGSVGAFYLAKVNTSGICEWIRGASYSDHGAGYKTIIDNNLIYTIGRVYNNQNTIEDVSFTSTNNPSYDISIYESDYFVTVYDPIGDLKKIIVSGNNSPQMFYVDNFTGFFKHNEAFYLSRNIGFFQGASNYNNFNHVIPSTNGIDATITKFIESCGIVHDVDNLGVEDLNNKLGDISVFPNPTQGSVSIELENYTSEIETTIYDLNGRKILSQKNIDKKNIEVYIKGDDGLYFIKVNTKNNNQWFKVLKKE